MLEPVTINWTAVLLAGLLNMVLGTLWYSPMLFGSSWATLMGKKPEDMKPSAVPLLSMFIIALAIGYIMSHFLVYAGATTFGLGLETGIWLGVGFVALTSASGAFAGGMDWKLWAINSGYWVVALALMGGLLAAM